jgi:hypothetical protein
MLILVVGPLPSKRHEIDCETEVNCSVGSGYTGDRATMSLQLRLRSILYLPWYRTPWVLILIGALRSDNPDLESRL